MKIQTAVVVFLVLFAAGTGHALEPSEILIIANADVPVSVDIAGYYCAKRQVPNSNILSLPLGTGISQTIARKDYDEKLVGPIRRKLNENEFAGKIKCLLTIYGVPVKAEGRGQLKGREDKLRQLEKLVEQKKETLKRLQQNGASDSNEQKQELNEELIRLQSDIDYITGRETGAAVDSELAMVLFGDYELYRWQPNKLRYKLPYWDQKSLMVCRLDGPSPDIARGLIDKALTAEKTGLNGVAYIDSRGIADFNKPYSFGYYDQSLRDLAELIKTRTKMSVVEENTPALFGPGQCPHTAIYCGWYSLKKYIDSFDFVDGAIGYHISSWEAVDIRDPNTTQWCPAMLSRGIAATLGAVAEPYLFAFPEPKEFFAELLDGCCLVEAYYRTSPFNSWQMVLIGDPFYKPFPGH